MDRPEEQLADELLVMRCQDGEADAMAELVRRWQQRLWRHAYRMTGREDGAWEVAQEAWLAIVRGIGRLYDPARFRGWAYRIVTNKAANWIARRRRRRDKQRELPADPPATGGDERTDPGEDLQAALRRLPKQRRAILSLHYLEGLTVAEIAAALSIPPGTVKSRLYHARNELKRIWEARPSQAGG